jgi:hypothetical protein
VLEAEAGLPPPERVYVEEPPNERTPEEVPEPEGAERSRPGSGRSMNQAWDVRTPVSAWIKAGGPPLMRSMAEEK